MRRARRPDARSLRRDARCEPRHDTLQASLLSDGPGTRCPVRMTDTTCAGHAPQHAAPATRSDSPFLSMSLHAADALIVLAKFVCASGTASTAKRVPCGANRSGKSVTARLRRSRGSQSGGMFQERIRIRRDTRQHAIYRIAHRDAQRMPERGWTAVSACKALLRSIEKVETH